MDKTERLALADQAMAALNGPTTQVPVTGDSVPPTPSEEPAKDTVTPPVEGQPEVEAGSDVSTPPEEVTFPEWVPEGSRDALKSLPKDKRELLIQHLDKSRKSIEADATKKWMDAAEAKKDAEKWRALVSDPVRGPKVLAALESTQEPVVNPHKAKLVEVLGEEAANALEAMTEAKATEKAQALIHEKVDAPVEHVRHVNEAAVDFRQRLGNRVTDEEFTAAMKVVGASLGWTAEDPDAPYRILSPQNVDSYLLTALQAIKASKSPAAPVASPPKPQAAKPASVKSNGMAVDTTAVPKWVQEKRKPTAAETVSRQGFTVADVERWIKSM